MTDQDIVVIDVPIDEESLPMLIGIRLVKKCWWMGLADKTKLKTIRPTKVYRDKFKTLIFSELKENDESLQYWGQIMEMTNYTLMKVYNTPELWVDVEDVRAK